MKRSLLALAIFTIACRNEAAAPASKFQPRHYDIRLDQLPKPFHTESAGNPPRVADRPNDTFLAAPPGFRVEVWAGDIENPRNMILAPNGDVFVAQQSANRIAVFRGGKRYVFTDDVDEPYGLAFRDGYLYIGCAAQIVRFKYAPGQLAAKGNGQRVFTLPGGGHRTRNIVFSRDGSKLFVAVGSGSNVDDETDEPLRAAITAMNPDGRDAHTFASGLRNPVGLAWNPTTGALWTAVNERDGLGDDLVPDYITDVKAGAFYGWPFSYMGRNIDPRRKGEHPELVAKAIPPAVPIQSHSASLGIAFYDGTMFPERYRGGAFVALHGSWNRTNRTGYKIIHVPFKNGKPTGGYDDFITGWSPDPSSRSVWGRPGCVLVLRDGSLLVGDDDGNVIWRISYQ